MPLTLIDDAGSADANTYASLASAEVYHAERLHNTAWTAATDAIKAAALAFATRVLDSSFEWEGYPFRSEQRLGFPRGGVYKPNSDSLIDAGSIPRELVDATAELAFRLIEGDPYSETEADKAGLRSLRAGPVTLEFSDYDVSGERASRALLSAFKLIPIEFGTTNVGRKQSRLTR